MNNLKTIKLNLYKLFWKYPYLKNKNYNYVYMSYVLEYHNADYLKVFLHQIKRPDVKEILSFWENMPAMESISRCKRKLALNDETFRPDKKEVIESRLKQSSEILESVKD